VRLPPELAIGLFTPRGEREWAQGWEPVFPADDADDGAPGTVFVTHGHHGSEAIWTVANRTERSIQYARVIPRTLAGTVEVRCEPAGSETIAHVTYDVTALDDGQRPRLSDFASSYDVFMDEWERELAAAVDRRS
jgi:hypothetical protein